MSFDDTFNGFSFSRAGLDIALPLADRDMAQNARRLLNLISIPDNHASASDRTRQAITILLPNGKATIGNVAALLNRAPRTLQRQLQSEHQSFASLLNEVKRDLAVRHLSDSPQNLISIAAALGYANSGSFSRWFAREFGRPPSGWRTSELSSGLNGEHEVIFSQRDGEVWASWLNRRPPVNLGAHEMVVAMMANYIEQSKAAERLLNISARMGSGLKR